ncbi:periostin-like isoform X1 [Cyprinodon tularosa]|uniref:periostin-like isoform X1 n=1 Tax=Cyprinodon tularosa TaxID=77115 RepID=UPI0018E25405|nr:periostin-like isoform X1 [Cyprinodon tularosa]
MDQLPVVTLAVLATCFLGSVDSSAYDKIVTHSRIRARNEGPNVCALQQVEGTKKKYFSTCRNWYRKSICGKKALVLYECCPGYMKLDGMRGCPAVAPIDNVYNTLEIVRAMTTKSYYDESNLREQIEGPGAFTVFAPSDDAWEELDPAVRAALKSNVNIELKNALHYHMVNHRLLTKDMKNGINVTSMYNNQGIYINHYPNGVVTVNCARIIHGNQIATNGVVHVIDRVITSVAGTINEYLNNDEDYSSFLNAAYIAGVMEELNLPGHFTLFLPTNAAFEKLTPGFMESIFENEPVIKALVTYHLLNSVQCAEAIMAGSVYETKEGSTIEIGCDGESLTVNGIKMVLKKDIVTSNGVIHIIDQVLIPDSAKEVRELIGTSQSMFGDLVSEMGLTTNLDLNTEYTVLATKDNAFTDEVMADDTYLRLILENHLLKLKVPLSGLYNGQQLETVSGKLLRVFIYRTAVCIESACMLQGSKTGINWALHVMSSLIKPADKTIFELLEADGKFKTFLSLMETAGLLDMLKGKGSYTIFAPSDEAFKDLSKDDLDLLRSDLNALRTILLYHFSDGIFINGGLERRVTNLLRSMQGINLYVKHENNSIYVNSVEVPNSDLMATNGVIHVVKNVLYPKDLPVGRQDLLLVLQRLIKYLEIKFLSGYTYAEIPLSFFTKFSTSTRYIEVPERGTITITEIETKPSTKQVTRVIKTETPVSKKVVVEGSKTTKFTRVIGRQPSVSKVTRIIGGGEDRTNKRKTETGEITITTMTEPQIISVPDLSNIKRIGENPALLKEESDKITKLIQGGRGFAAARRAPAGIKRRARPVKRHNKPKE